MQCTYVHSTLMIHYMALWQCNDINHFNDHNTISPQSAIYHTTGSCTLNHQIISIKHFQLSIDIAR